MVAWGGANGLQPHFCDRLSHHKQASTRPVRYRTVPGLVVAPVTKQRVHVSRPGEMPPAQDTPSWNREMQHISLGGEPARRRNRAGGYHRMRCELPPVPAKPPPPQHALVDAALCHGGLVARATSPDLGDRSLRHRVARLAPPVGSLRRSATEGQLPCLPLGFTQSTSLREIKASWRQLPPSLGVTSPIKPLPAARSRPSPDVVAVGHRTRVAPGAEVEAANARAAMGVPTAGAVEGGMKARRQRAAAELVAVNAAIEAAAEAAAEATAEAAAHGRAAAAAAAAARAAAMPQGTLVVHGVRAAASPHADGEPRAATSEDDAAEEGLDGRNVCLRFLLMLPGGKHVAAGETSALAGATHLKWRGEQLPLPLPLPRREPSSSVAVAALSLRVDLWESGGGEGASDGADGRVLAMAEVPLDTAHLTGGQAELLLAPLDPALGCSMRVSFLHTLLPPGYRAKSKKRAASTELTGMSVHTVSVSVT